MGKVKYEKLKSYLLHVMSYTIPLPFYTDFQYLKCLREYNLFTPDHSHSNTDWPLTGRSGPRLRWKMLPGQWPVFHGVESLNIHRVTQVRNALVHVTISTLITTLSKTAATKWPVLQNKNMHTDR